MLEQHTYSGYRPDEPADFKRSEVISPAVSDYCDWLLQEISDTASPERNFVAMGKVLDTIRFSEETPPSLEGGSEVEREEARMRINTINALEKVVNNHASSLTLTEIQDTTFALDSLTQLHRDFLLRIFQNAADDNPKALEFFHLHPGDGEKVNVLEEITKISELLEYPGTGYVKPRDLEALLFDYKDITSARNGFLLISRSHKAFTN